MDFDTLADRLAQSLLPLDERTNPDYRDLLFGIVIPLAQQLEDERHCPCLVNRVQEVLPQRLRSYRQARGRFRSWLETLLHRLVLDERSRHKRLHFVETDLGGGTPVDGSSPLADLPIEDRNASRESLLEQLAEMPRNSRQRTDFLAILHLSIRLAAVSRMRRASRALRGTSTSRTQLAERHFPWTPNTGQRRIQAGWPPLTMVWQSLAQGLEATDRKPSDGRIVRLLANVVPQVRNLAAETWRQWRKRAFAWGRQALGLEIWQAEMEPWLATRAARYGHRV